MATKLASGKSKAVNKLIPRRATSGGKRPATRRVQNQPSVFGRFVRDHFGLIVLGAAAIGIGVLIYVGYQRAAASSFFELRRVDVAGTSHTEKESIEKLVRTKTAQSGVWNSDLTAIKNEIEQSAWVKTAIVSRVLPDGLRVRIVEREPKAVVRLDSGAKVWVDEDARILGEYKTGETAPFVMLGWNESRTDAADSAKKNQDRVRLYLRLVDDWKKAETIAQVAAVDLKNMQNVEALITQNETVIPIKLGDKNFAERLKTAVEQLKTIADNSGLEMIDKINADTDRPPSIILKTAEKPTTQNPKTRTRQAR